MKMKERKPFPVGVVKAEYLLSNPENPSKKLRAYRVLERHMDKDGGGKKWCCYEAIVHLQPYCNNGGLAVVNTPRGLMYGRFYHRGKTVELRPINPEYDSIKFPASKISIVGEVDGFDSCPKERKQSDEVITRELAEARRSGFVSVEGFGVRAEVDDIGLLHVVVSAGKGKEALMVDHPASGTDKGSEHFVYTNDPSLVAWEIDRGDEYGDHRINPKKLREAAKSNTFRAWWGLQYKESPEEYAAMVEAVRRRDAAKQAGMKKIESVAGGQRGRN